MQLYSDLSSAGEFWKLNFKTITYSITATSVHYAEFKIVKMLQFRKR
jgi:hypothetical protein